MNSGLIIQATGRDYQGFIVIDTLYHETSSGGVRIASDLVVEEVQELAAEMSKKYALFHLPRGGAKAGVRMVGTLDRLARRSALEDFGRRIGPIIRAGLYFPGMDMNCGPEELQAICRGAGTPIGTPTDTSLFTAIGAANAIEGYADALDRSQPMTLAIEGFGSVARHLVTMLPPARFRVVAISTIQGAIISEGFAPEELGDKQVSYGDGVVRELKGRSIPLEELLAVEADILVPSARTGSITEGVASAMRAGAVIPIANAPYRSGSWKLLQNRGVICLPGYLCNAGGVFGSSMADSGIPLHRVESMFRSRFRVLIRDLVHRCGAAGLSPVAAIEEIATRAVSRRDEHPEKDTRAHSINRRVTRRLPRWLRGQLVWRQFDQSFAALEREVSRIGAGR